MNAYGWVYFSLYQLDKSKEQFEKAISIGTREIKIYSALNMTAVAYVLGDTELRLQNHELVLAMEAQVGEETDTTRVVAENIRVDPHELLESDADLRDKILVSQIQERVNSGYLVGQDVKIKQGNNNNILLWKEKEKYLSLGVGHFLWYPESANVAKEDQSFINFIAYVEKNAPEYHQQLWYQRYMANPAFPWTSRDTFIADRDALDERYLALVEFLENTKTVQVAFMVDRFNQSVDKMLVGLTEEKRQKLLIEFNRVSHEPLTGKISGEGITAMFNYVGFKGEGTSNQEVYNGVRVGLLQVLLNMPNGSTNLPVDDFIVSAKAILEQRIAQNPEDSEHRIQWWKTLESYRKVDYTLTLNSTIPSTSIHTTLSNDEV